MGYNQKENNPRWKGGCVPKKCAGCGGVFTPKDHPERTVFCSRRCSKIGKNNPQWKEDVGYSGLHLWVYRQIEKPSNCPSCGKAANLDIANKSGKYKRDLSDWEWLCRRCHMIKDGVTDRLIKNSKSRAKYGDKNCSYCGGIFRQYFEKQKFCSKSCSTTYENKNNRKYLKGRKGCAPK